MKKAKRMFERLFKIIKLEEMRILPGQLAFFFVLSIFSILPLIGLIGSNFITQELIHGFDRLPSAVSAIFKSLIDAKSQGFNIILFFISSIYISSNGCGSMIITSNVIFKIKNDNAIRQKIKAIIMTLVLIILILFLVLVPAFGDIILKTIEGHYPGRLMTLIISIYEILKYPLSFILIFFGVKILYTMAPDKQIESSYMNYGALLTTVSWILITRIYAVYLNNINTYNIFYGSLANVVILLFWIYLLAYAFTLGMALNSERYLDSQKNVNQD